MTAGAARPDLGVYRRFVGVVSGGKDSLAALTHLLVLNVSRHAIELRHHHVDGPEPTLMDWLGALGYICALADHVGIALYIS